MRIAAVIVLRRNSREYSVGSADYQWNGGRAGPPIAATLARQRMSNQRPPPRRTPTKLRSGIKKHQQVNAALPLRFHSPTISNSTGLLLFLQTVAGERMSTIDITDQLATLFVMDKSDSQLNPKTKKLFTETEVGVLLEDIDQKLGVIAEGQTGLVGRMERFEGRITRLDVKVDTLTDTVGEMKLELTEVNEKLDRKADRSQVTQLDRRVSVLEAK